ELSSFHIGYWVAAEFAGKGYISESTNALTRYGFEVLKARRLEIRCDERNASSFGVMDRLGYVREGVLKNGDLDTEGVPRNTIVTARCDLAGLPPLDVSW
ncbi:MAG TPA: GNAT family protein, partial [Verrucomicrobiae bacterium]|nr:GNAT family protein [Verrucomicrobiae bacterium]